MSPITLWWLTQADRRRGGGSPPPNAPINTRTDATSTHTHTQLCICCTQIQGARPSQGMNQLKWVATQPRHARDMFVWVKTCSQCARDALTSQDLHVRAHTHKHTHTHTHTRLLSMHKTCSYKSGPACSGSDSLPRGWSLVRCACRFWCSRLVDVSLHQSDLEVEHRSLRSDAVSRNQSYVDQNV